MSNSQHDAQLLREAHLSGQMSAAQSVGHFGDPSPTPVRGWYLEFEADGMPFVWTGTAPNQSAAEDAARDEFARDWTPYFNRNTARLVACLERQA